MKELSRDEHVVCAASALDIPSLDREGRKKVMGDLWDTAYVAGARMQASHDGDMTRLARGRAGLDPDAENDEYVSGVIDGIAEERARWRVLTRLLPSGLRTLLAPFALPLNDPVDPDLASTGNPHAAWERDEDDVHVDWHMTKVEWRQLRDALMAYPESPYVQQLVREGKLRPA